MAVGLSLGRKSKISHEQNVKEFQFYIRMPNFRLLGSIVKKKYPKVADPLKRLLASLFEKDLCEVGQMLVEVDFSLLLAYHRSVDLYVVGQMLVKVDFSLLLAYHRSVDLCVVGQMLVKVDFLLLLAYIFQ